jgi:4-amino-4-deoxy-L-arabinose transferase-like glycosyltransferase
VSVDSIPYPASAAAPHDARRPRLRLARLFAYPELVGLIGVTAALNLWNLGINGWANTYYAAAVRSMSTSWHNFLFASLDPSGLMTVDKPPLALWVQALSVRVFGFHPLSILVPQALMGVAAVALVYDLVRRRFGRFGGFVAGLALATTPTVVAVSRHNNPDELLVLCCVAALWCALRALDTGRTKWLVLSGVCVGLGFETKMAVALLVVPGIALAWQWMRSGVGKGRLRAIRPLLAGGAAMAAVGLAWPLLVTLTPAADRPWISGTSDNSIWSLIFGYNGLGRVSGQTGGPGGIGGGTLFGGPAGPLRLIGSALGDQAGWLLGFAIVAGIALIALTRLRRGDPRTGWLIAVGGAFLTAAVVFSFAQGIFHPYYVSFLAPFGAALIGAGAGLMVSGDLPARILAPLGIAAGAVTELVVLGELGGRLSWATPLLIGVGGVCAIALAARLSARTRVLLTAVALAALLAAPATWAAETLGHATNGTFPTGGPAGAADAGGPGGPGGGGGPPGFGPGGGGGFGPGGGGGLGPGGGSGFGPGGGRGFGPAPGGGGGFGDDSASLTAAVRYVEAHGGGTIGVSSQSSAATAILSSNANVAGLGGFSGRESSLSARWLAMEVRAGRLRWVIDDGSGGARLPGDTRTGSQTAMSVVAHACHAVTVAASDGSGATIYDCLGRSAQILRVAQGSGLSVRSIE